MPHPPEAPKGFDPSVWREFIRFNPKGVDTINVGSIVTQGKAEDYAVLPHLAGIAQLVANGSIVPAESQKQYMVQTKNEGNDVITIVGGGGNDTVTGRGVTITTVTSKYKIVKNIDRLPGGMGGALSRDFILAKGIKLPGNADFGHACIISEESGEALAGSCARMNRPPRINAHPFVTQ